MDASSEDQTKEEAKPSILSLISPQRKEPKEMCYFNSKAKITEVSMFDRMYRNIEDFETKKQYHTKKHSRERGLDINEEEKSRPVALLSSSEYGRRFNSTINRTAKRHPRVALIKSDFYRKSGIIWSMAEGYGSVVPL
ncbi:uncharacterized protein C5orf49 [Poecilia latipinna]|uniref:Cilia and flagella associated protein 90 n=2 Tax=Poecilia TaxID=8080 RepID=A0A087XBB4_POEFO|nr:PREDICTED: uncharacterized protein C5orf49 homolog [Poecilia formosa]XP_014911522.1 PREDICTED: uncharacterized protein C5orf49 homolog [Poecilia latipinna]